MTDILVGLDGSTPSERALIWAARYADARSASITLLTVLDPTAIREAGTDEATARDIASKLLRDAQRTLALTHPTVETEPCIVKGRSVDALVDAADAHDMIVLGTHRGTGIGDIVGGATGLRVSVSTVVPTVVVPAN